MAAFSVLITFLLFPLIFLVNTSVSLSHKPILPKSAIIPITTDLTTHQYVATVSMGPNLDPVELVLDLNGRHTWVDCASHGVNSVSSLSTSHQPIESFSLKCSMAKSTTSNCFSHGGGGGGEVEHNPKICTLQAENTVSRTSALGQLIETKMGVEFCDGGRVGSGSFAGNGQFLFLCTSDLLLKGLANGAKGMLGLDNSRISLPSQFSTKFVFLQRRFSMCLPSSASSSSGGFISLGGNHPHDQSAISSSSSSMMYTPLVSKRNGLQQGYYIYVNSINISGKKVSLRRQKGSSSLETKLSTVVPYTVLGSKIYGTFVEAYVKAAASMNLTLVPRPVEEPLEVCFSSKGVAGPNYNVPVIELVLQSEMVKWNIYGRNSMVHVSDEVMCLGFVNGGLSTRDSIVLGGYQMEDCVLDFNLGNNMLGFSSSLSMGENKCSDFASASREFL